MHDDGPVNNLGEIAQAFGGCAEIVPLKGGQGKAFRAGSIVIKPADSAAEAEWVAATFSQLPDTAEIRIPKPVKSLHGHWIESGYVAWLFVTGETKTGAYLEKSRVCDAYHRLVCHVARPAFLDTRNDAWSIADRKAWDEEELDYGAEFAAVYRPLLSSLADSNLPNQLIHGDFSGNVLFADGLPPAVIDFSPYWRPAAFAQAVILIDAATLDETATSSELLNVFGSIENIGQLTTRAALRRIFEQFEHSRLRRIEKAEAMSVAELYRAAYQRLFS